MSPDNEKSLSSKTGYNQHTLSKIVSKIISDKKNKGENE
jgi:hypothetical protein